MAIGYNNDNNNLFENASVGSGDLDDSALNDATAQSTKQPDLNNSSVNSQSGSNSYSSPSSDSTLSSGQGSAANNGSENAVSEKNAVSDKQSGENANPDISRGISSENDAASNSASPSSIKGAQPSTDSPGITNNVAGTGGSGSTPNISSESVGNGIEGASETAANTAANTGRNMAGGVGSGSSAGAAIEEGAASSAAGASSIGQTLSGLVSNAAGAIGNAVSSFASTAFTFAQGAFTSMVGAFGAAGTALTMSLAVGALGVGGVAAYNALTSNQRIDDTLIADECDVDSMYTELAYNKYDDIDVDAATLENATKIYSVMKAYGWPDELIAGLCGCIECECGFDPTCIEYMESVEPFQFGEQKQALFDKDSNGRYNHLPTSGMTDLTYKTIAWYNNHNYSISESTYLNGGNPSVGIGLLQWTGSSCYDFLDYCTEHNTDWYNIDTQLTYLISPNGYYRHKYCEDPKSYTKYSVTDSSGNYAVNNCTDWCEWYITGHANQGDNNRRNAAQRWFLKFAEMDYDASYAESILNAAAANASAASGNDEEDDGCEDDTVMYAEVDDLVYAAMSMSWPTQALSKQNPSGTQEFQTVNKAVGQTTGAGTGDSTGCSQFTYAAIHWSGIDEDYPAPPCAHQLKDYMLKDGAQDKWALIGTLQEIDHDASKTLEPGDLILSSGHTYIWLGTDVIQEEYQDIWNAYRSGSYEKGLTAVPTSGSNCAMASLGSHSAAIESDGYSSGSGSTGYNDFKGNPFYVFRLIDGKASGTDTAQHKQIKSLYDSLKGVNNA